MIDTYVFRLFFCEFCTTAAVLYFLFKVLPCRNSKWGAVIIAYAVTIFYCIVMLITQEDIGEGGIVYRSILLISEQQILPCYLIGDKTWYRYIGFTTIGDLIASSLGSVFFTPPYFMLTGGSTLDISHTVYDVYRGEGNFHILLIYVIANFLAYLAVAYVVRKITRSKRRAEHLLFVCQILFVVIYIANSMFTFPNREISIQSTSVNNLIILGLAFVFFVRGMVWERTEVIRNQKLIQIRETMQYERYQQIYSRQQKARAVRHDLADHMQTVKLLLEKGDLEGAEKYVRDCRDQSREAR